MNSTPRSSSVVALLDLPQGTVLTLDGKAIVLQKSDFVGFDGIPTDHFFHFLTIQVPISSRADNVNSVAYTVGFIAATPSYSPVAIVRRFDPFTCEVSSVPVDVETESNLLRSIYEGRVDQERLLSYSLVLSKVEQDAWRNRTSFVSARLLRKRGLQNGDKIIPGTYEMDDTLETPSKNNAIVDGKAVVYPPIPTVGLTPVARHVRHHGTRCYLAQLLPSERTLIFTDPAPQSRLMENVLERYYDHDWKDWLGDLQLSYLFFLWLRCLSSFEHWRDLVVLLSAVDTHQVVRYRDLYERIFSILGSQIQTMESDFFEDVELSGDNFFVPSIRQICHTCYCTKDATIMSLVQNFMQVVSGRFPRIFQAEIQGTNEDIPTSSRCAPRPEFSRLLEDCNKKDSDYNLEVSGDSYDEDGPAVVADEEIEAFVARSAEGRLYPFHFPQLQYSQDIRDSYPLLFAAMMPHEDILMVCSRALCEASDVSLVREAASYLENVEAKRKPSGSDIGSMKEDTA